MESREHLRERAKAALLKSHLTTYDFSKKLDVSLSTLKKVLAAEEISPPTYRKIREGLTSAEVQEINHKNDEALSLAISGFAQSITITEDEQATETPPAPFSNMSPQDWINIMVASGQFCSERPSYKESFNKLMANFTLGC